MDLLVTAQRSQGVTALFERLNDLGMSDVETPTELLQGYVSFTLSELFVTCLLLGGAWKVLSIGPAR